ncbi:MAG TPA: tetratricopeptide repeat protein, partial [Acidobacteriota bacterium]|nr:tetratricopeptide repeat protein [Acidobacteriota bacterium]
MPQILLLVIASSLGSVSSSQSASLSQAELAQRAESAAQAMNSRDFERASQLYREIVEAVPGLPAARLNLGMALYMSGQFGEAATQLEKVIKADESLLPAFLFLGASYLESGKLQQAVSPLTKYVDTHPEDPQGRRALGEALFYMDRYEEALPHLQKLTEMEPKDSTAWYRLGRCYEQLAAQAFQTLGEVAPESSYWFALIADSRLAQRQFRSAFYFYKKALEANPKMRGINVAMSQIYRHLDQPEWAEEAENKEALLGPPDCQTEKMVCDFLAGRPHDVLATARNDNSSEALYWKSQVYNQLAVEAFSQLGKLPPSFESHQLRAEIHGRQGRHLEAVEEWKKALELSPGHPVARRGLASSLYLSRNYEEARPLVNELLNEQPDDPQLNYLAGAMFLNQEEGSEAIPFLEKAVSRDPS